MSFPTRVAVVTVSLALLLTGCSSQSETKDAPPVATLQSAAAPSSAPAGDEQPVYPVDASEDQINEVAKPWITCLRKEGVKDPGDAAQLLEKGGTSKDMAEVLSGGDEAPWKACESRRPESVEQFQLRTNPSEFKDNQRKFYRCAQAAGYKLTAPDPETGEFGLTEVGPNGDFRSEKMQKCRRQAFAG